MSPHVPQGRILSSESAFRETEKTDSFRRRDGLSHDRHTGSRPFRMSVSKE